MVFEKFLDEYGPGVLRFCLARAPRDQAEDCFQETMLSALEYYSQASGKAWLYTIANRKCVDAHRQNTKQQKTKALLKPMESYEMVLEDPRKVAAVLSALSSKQQTAVLLRVIGEMEYAEIATIMKISEAAARKNVSEALKTLSHKKTLDSF